MGELVLGIGTSHWPLLDATRDEPERCAARLRGPAIKFAGVAVR